MLNWQSVKECYLWLNDCRDIDKKIEKKKIISNKADHLCDFSYLPCLLQELIFFEQKTRLFR